MVHGVHVHRDVNTRRLLLKMKMKIIEVSLQTNGFLYFTLINLGLI